LEGGTARTTTGAGAEAAQGAGGAAAAVAMHGEAHEFLQGAMAAALIKGPCGRGRGAITPAWTPVDADGAVGQREWGWADCLGRRGRGGGAGARRRQVRWHSGGGAGGAGSGWGGAAGAGGSSAGGRAGLGAMAAAGQVRCAGVWCRGSSRMRTAVGAAAEGSNVPNGGSNNNRSTATNSSSTATCSSSSLEAKSVWVREAYPQQGVIVTARRPD
jgi:hypothetical protein